MARVPDLGSTRPLQLVADLHIELSSERGDAQAHLRGGLDGLVLEVDNPAALIRQARGQELPLAAVRQLVSDIPLQVHSGGRRLANVSLTSAGKLRVRPTPAGLLSAPKIALDDSRARFVVVSVVAVLLSTAAVRLFRRRR